MQNILTNFPHCETYDDASFVGRWHEERVLDISKYWQLEYEIFQLAASIDKDSIPRETAWIITRIFSYIMMSIQAHYDPDDLFHLDVTAEELHQFRERFHIVMEGFFKGNMPKNNFFEIVNPLLET